MSCASLSHIEPPSPANVSSRTTSVPGQLTLRIVGVPAASIKGSVQGLCGCAAAHWIDNIYHQWTLQDILKVEIDGTLGNCRSQIRIIDKR